MPTVQVGGRPRQIELSDIVRVGRELGMRDLSLNAVAARLKVSAAALYRHVDGRWGLERLVGEEVLADLDLVDDPAQDADGQLLGFGLQLYRFAVGHPGLPTYLQTLFPRGTGGERLMTDQVAALAPRGYAPDAAIVISGAVASMAIGYAAATEAQREHADGLAEQQQEALTRLHEHAELGVAHRDLPQIDMEDYVRLVLTAAIRGLVAVAPPGRPVDEVLADLGREEH